MVGPARRLAAEHGVPALAVESRCTDAGALGAEEEALLRGPSTALVWVNDQVFPEELRRKIQAVLARQLPLGAIAVMHLELVELTFGDYLLGLTGLAQRRLPEGPCGLGCRGGCDHGGGEGAPGGPAACSTAGTVQSVAPTGEGGDDSRPAER